jgi:hypothetical protein
MDGAPRATTIPLVLSLLTGSSGLPGSFGRAVRQAPCCQGPALPYLALLRAGFCLPLVLPRARCALTAPFHPYSPSHLPVREASGIFSVPLSFGLPRPGVTRRTALRSSDFPPFDLAPKDASKDDRLFYCGGNWPPQQPISRILSLRLAWTLSRSGPLRVTIIPLAPALLTGSSGLPGGFGRAVL